MSKTTFPPKYPETSITVSPVVSGRQLYSNRHVPMDFETVQVTSDSVQVTSDAVQVTSDPAQVTSDPAQVTSDPAQVTSDPAQVTSDAVEVTSDTGTSTRKRLRSYDDLVENCSKKIYEAVSCNILNAFAQFTRKIDSQAEMIEDLKRRYDSQAEVVEDLKRRFDSQAEVVEDLKRRFDSQDEYVLELESGMSEHRVEILDLKGSVQSLEADNGGLHHLVDVLKLETVQLRHGQEQAEDAYNILILEGRTQAAILRETIATLHDLECRLPSN